MTGARLICLLVLIMVHAGTAKTEAVLDQEVTEMANVTSTRWEELEVIADQIRFDTNMSGIKQNDVYIFYLWERYKRSSRSERAQIVQEIRDTLIYMASLDKTIDMIGLLLFGPQNGRSSLHSVRGPGLPVVDDWECFRSTVDLFEKHCGVLTEYGMKHLSAFANICNNLVDMAAVEKAFKVTCPNKIVIPYDQD